MSSKNKHFKGVEDVEGEIDDDLLDEPEFFDISRSKMKEDIEEDSEEDNSDDEQIDTDDEGAENKNNEDIEDIEDVDGNEPKNNMEESEEETSEETEDDYKSNAIDETIKSDTDIVKHHNTCIYKIKNKSDSKILFDEQLDTIFEDDIITQTKQIVPPDERITKPILTKYERVRLLSERRKQLILGAKPMIKISDRISEKEIASLELKSKVIPFIIVRTLPNGNMEHWKLEELEIVN